MDPQTNFHIPFETVATLELAACSRFIFQYTVWSATIDGMLYSEESMWEKVRKWEVRGMQFDIPTYQEL